MSGADRGTRQTAQGAKRGVSAPIVGLIMLLAGIGLSVAVGLLAPEIDRKPPPRPSRGTTGSTIEDNGARGTVTIRLSGCVSVPANTGYTGALCDWAGGDFETAVATVWVVQPSRPANGTTLTCPAEGFAQRGKRRCRAGGRTFWLEPVQ